MAEAFPPLRSKTLTRHRILYLPVETKARELIGKTFLAARAVERGWIVVLGEGNALRDWMNTRPPGAYIEIGVPEKKTNRLKRIRASGHRIASLCEEGLVYSDGLDYCKRKLGPSVIPWIDRLLVIGERQAQDIRTHRPAFADKVSVVGNPRFDVLLSELRGVYQPEGDRIRRELGRFVLFNSNFTRANPLQATDKDGPDEPNPRKKALVEERAELMRRFVAFQVRLMDGAQQFLRQLASSAKVDRLVVRPHPTENHEAWTKWAAPLDIEIRQEGSAIEWMLAAEAVVHAGCTTGIEGLLLDRPVYSYLPQPDSEFLNPADLVSQWVTTPEEFTQQLIKIRSTGGVELRRQQKPQREKLSQFVANMSPPLSADRILDELESFDLPTVGAREITTRSGWLGSLWKNLKEGPKPPLTPRKLQKFPATNVTELQRCIDQWIGDGALKQSPAIKILGERLWVFCEG